MRNSFKVLVALIASLFSYSALSDNQKSKSPILELMTVEQVTDFTRGLTFFAPGGGGDPLFGNAMLNEAIAAGKRIRIIDINELKPNDKTICPFLMGTAGPETEEINRTKKTFGLTKKTTSNMPAEAAKLLQKYEGTKISAVIPIELGGASTASSVATAAWLDVPTVDGDYTGRAMPEITNSIPAIQKINLFPLASADSYGNQAIITNTSSNEMTERLGKQISIASFGLVGQANLLLSVNHAKPLILDHTLTKAYALGTAIRLARENNSDPIAAIIEKTNSKVIFAGKIVEIQAQTQNGYYIGQIIIQGIEEYKDNQLKIWFKNENLISWLNSKPYVSSPDLITMVEQKTGEPLINSQIKNDMVVVVFGLPAPAIFRTKGALANVGPGHFGFDIHYKPFLN